jgi:hypothetical protein
MDGWRDECMDDSIKAHGEHDVPCILPCSCTRFYRCAV